MSSLARQLARFVRETRDDALPAKARAMARDAIVDCAACMLAGSREPLAGIVARTLLCGGSAPEGVPLLGATGRASPADAALYHGAIAHALDYDDTNHPAFGHPTAVILPAALAVAPLAQVSGREVVTAHILGVEVFGKLGRALNTDHYKRGWHSTATFGTLAAAIVAGRLLKLDEAQLVNAIGIAASAASGLRVNFGTMVKPLHAGYAARNGVLAALLAREGCIASEASLDHRYGYCNVLSGGLHFDLAPLSSWGDPLEILTEYGLALKPYPSCGATHPAIEAAIALSSRIGGREIVRVHAGVCRMAFEPLIHVLPATPLEGKFSLHYCVAAALVDGKVDLATFTPDKVADPRIRSLVPRIAMEVDDALAEHTEFPAAIAVELADGTRLTQTVLLAQGKPERWMTRGQLAAKFADCAQHALPSERIGPLFERLLAMDGEASFDGIASLG